MNSTIKKKYLLKNGVYLLKIKKWYDEYILCDFETMKCRVPIGYHEVLRKWYGDYTVLPPREQQKPHGIFKVYMNENKNINRVWN